MTRDPDVLRRLAVDVGNDWISQPYYEEAERFIDEQWESVVWPFISDADLSVVVDLAAGHGRNSAKLVTLAEKLYIVDINETNVELCRKRFSAHPNVTIVKNDGFTLSFLPDSSVTLVYCFDSMVHFDSDVVRSYLAETQRVLTPDGRGFFHHSNYVDNPGGDIHDNPGWRNFMSASLFAHYAAKEGLELCRQRIVDWVCRESDCVSLIRKAVPAGEGV
jgi:ubiquinone/menaquinone biosynthesis C-methylase UbiE